MLHYQKNVCVCNNMGEFYFTIFIVSFMIFYLCAYCKSFKTSYPSVSLAQVIAQIFSKNFSKKSEFCCEQFFSTWVIQILHEQFYFCL